MTDTSKAVMFLSTEILRSIDDFLEDFYPESVSAGTKLAEVGLKTSQIRGLETLVASTTRFSEIINYIKNQVGKEKKEENRWLQAGPMLLDQLSKLESNAKRIAEGLPQAILDIKIRMARGWIKQTVSHYMFTMQFSKKKVDDNDDN